MLSFKVPNQIQYKQLQLESGKNQYLGKRLVIIKAKDQWKSINLHGR